MRPALLVGILLLLVGGFVLVRGGTFTSRRDVIDIGGVRVSADQRHSVTPWMAGLALVAGTVLVISSSRRRA